MSKKIVVTKTDGSTEAYKATLFKGVHLHEVRDGYCITEKPLIGKEKVVQCYAKESVRKVEKTDCKPCSFVNPSQVSSIRVED